MAKNETSRVCVFCGSPADSGEHVFALRLCQRAQAKKFQIVVGHSVDGKPNLTRNQHPIERLKIRHVCAKCNNGWMNDLEGWFENQLGFLIEPKWPNLALTMIEELRPERHKLAQWLMKTAVMFNLASLQGDNQIKFSSAITHNVKNGILPENCWVDLAYSKTIPSIIAGTITRSFQVINGGQPMQILRMNNGGGFKFIVQFNHLLLRIAQAHYADVIYQGRGEIPVRLYPTPTPRIPENFAYDNFMAFEHSVILKTWEGCRGNIH